MLGSIGMGELLVIFVIALIVFGPRKLPELGRTLGKSLGEFKRASNDLRNTLEEEINVDEKTGRTPAPRASAPAAAVPDDDPNNLEEEIHVEQPTSSAPTASAPAPATPADDPQHNTARSV